MLEGCTAVESPSVALYSKEVEQLGFTLRFLVPMVAAGIRGGGAGPMHVPPGGTHQDLESKIDQMMGMLSGTQQLLLAQQATTQRLENSIAKVNAEVETLQADFKKISEVATATTSVKTRSSKKVPAELKVISYLYTMPIFAMYN